MPRPQRTASCRRLRRNGTRELVDVLLHRAMTADHVTAGISAALTVVAVTAEVVAVEADPRPCAAIVDRLTYHGTIIETGTHSYCLATAALRQPADPNPQLPDLAATARSYGSAVSRASASVVW